METHNVELLAGSIASLFFITSNLPMLLKAYKTKNLGSYSLTYLLLNILGDTAYWLYIGSLPVGPIWVMHAFYTVTSILMLVGYIRYEYAKPSRKMRTA